MSTPSIYQISPAILRDIFCGVRLFAWNYCYASYTVLTFSHSLPITKEKLFDTEEPEPILGIPSMASSSFSGWSHDENQDKKLKFQSSIFVFMANPIRLVVVKPALVLLAHRTGTRLRNPRGSVQTELPKLLVPTLVWYYYFFEGTIQTRYSCSYQVCKQDLPSNLVSIAEVF